MCITPEVITKGGGGMLNGGGGMCKSCGGMRKGDGGMRKGGGGMCKGKQGKGKREGRTWRVFWMAGICLALQPTS
jgi:hypothetical protein